MLVRELSTRVIDSLKTLRLLYNIFLPGSLRVQGQVDCGTALPPCSFRMQALVPAACSSGLASVCLTLRSVLLYQKVLVMLVEIIISPIQASKL